MIEGVLRRLIALIFIHAFDAEPPNSSRFNIFGKNIADCVDFGQLSLRKVYVGLLASQTAPYLIQPFKTTPKSCLPRNSRQ